MRESDADRINRTMSALPAQRPFHYAGKSFATPYFVQYATSGRSKVRMRFFGFSSSTSLVQCQTCKQMIAALSLRVGKIKPPMCFWYHAHCFQPPATVLDVGQLGAAECLEPGDREQLQQRLDAVAVKRGLAASSGN